MIFFTIFLTKDLKSIIQNQSYAKATKKYKLETNNRKSTEL